MVWENVEISTLAVIISASNGSHVALSQHVLSISFHTQAPYWCQNVGTTARGEPSRHKWARRLGVWTPSPRTCLHGTCGIRMISQWRTLDSFQNARTKIYRFERHISTISRVGLHNFIAQDPSSFYREVWNPLSWQMAPNSACYFPTDRLRSQISPA